MPRHSPTIGSYGGAVSYHQSTPVEHVLGEERVDEPRVLTRHGREHRRGLERRLVLEHEGDVPARVGRGCYLRVAQINSFVAQMCLSRNKNCCADIFVARMCLLQK